MTRPLPARDGRRGDPDREAVRAAGRLLAGRHLGDRRRGGDQLHRGPGRWPACSAAASPPTPHRSRPRLGTRPRPRSGRRPGRRVCPARPGSSELVGRRPKRLPAPGAALLLAGSRARRRTRRAGARRPPKKRRPKPAGSNTSSSSPSPAPAMKPPSEAAPQMPYLATTLRPKGDLLSGFSLLDTGRPAQLGRGDQRPAADRSTKADCRPTRTSPHPPSTSKGVVSGSGCVYSAETLTLADQLGARPVQLARLHGRDGQPRNGRTRQLRLPAARRPRGSRAGRLRGAAQPVRLLPLAARPRRLCGQRRPASPNSKKT